MEKRDSPLLFLLFLIHSYWFALLVFELLVCAILTFNRPEYSYHKHIHLDSSTSFHWHFTDTGNFKGVSIKSRNWVGIIEYNWLVSVADVLLHLPNHHHNHQIPHYSHMIKCDRSQSSKTVSTISIGQS